MGNLLKAMGFWMWGLIAIGLSVSLVSVSYRMLAAYRSHNPVVSSQPAEVGSKVEVASPPALFGERTQTPAAPNKTAVDASRQPVISRVIAKEISAAQKAMQAARW
jgi:hypothetical protein